jgi:hypothetical protein
MKLMKAMLCGCVLVCSVAGTAATGQAADSYSNSLTGFTGDSTQAGTQGALGAAGLTVFNTSGAAVTFDSAGAHFGTADPGDAGRNYIRTVVSDFALSSFVAEITFTTRSDDEAVFFGVGTGDTVLWGTPDWATQFSSASFWPETGNDKFVRFRTQDDVNAFSDTQVTGGLDPGVHRFRMTFDAGAQTLLGEIDKNYAGGAFVADAVTFNFPINVSTLFGPTGWPGEPSRIFFGGDDGATFRDLSIVVTPVPVPAAVWSGLGMLGVMGVVAWRKRKC